MSQSILRTARFLALGAALTLGVLTPAAAQPSREFERVELGYLNEATRAEVTRRAGIAGNTHRGVMETIMLNNLQLRLPATEVVAIDFLKTTVAYRSPDGQLRSVRFNPADLSIIQ